MTDLFTQNGVADGAIAPVRFGRGELGRILSLYSRRVSGGEWRDYAIDQMPGRAVFSIFRNSLEGPLYTITKWGDGDWEIANRTRCLKQTDNIDDALAFISRQLRIV